MFKNLVRSERYLITAVLYLPKNMDTKMVSFLSSGAGTAMLDDLDKRGYRVFCVSLNFELNGRIDQYLQLQARQFTARIDEA